MQVTVYLGKRDFVDHLDHVDPVGESAHLEVCILIFYQLFFIFEFLKVMKVLEKLKNCRTESW